VGVFVVRILRNGIQIVLKKAGNHFPFAFSFCFRMLKPMKFLNTAA